MISPGELSRAISGRASIGTCAIVELGGRIPVIAELAELGSAASEKRRHDFILGRLAARRALRGLGICPPSIPIGAQREPVWPPGIVGSISHSNGLGLAVAARTRDFRGIGVDIEARDRTLSSGGARKVLTKAEGWALDESDAKPWPLIVFCAKEAAYKAIFQTCGARLGFQDIAFSRVGTRVLIGIVQRSRQRSGADILPRDDEYFPSPIVTRFVMTSHFVITCVELGHGSAAGNELHTGRRHTGAVG
jgi:4'-phosphopantetheinyl transferase EntD